MPKTFRNEDDLLRLAELLAQRTVSLLNTSSIATDFKMRRETAEKYISILEHLFLANHLPAWHNNQARRLVKAPRLYLVDSGFAAFMNNLKPTEWRIVTKIAFSIH